MTDSLGGREQSPIARERLHRRPAEASLDLDRGTLEDRLQVSDRALQPLSCSHRRRTHVDDGTRRGRNDIGTESSVDRAHVHRDALRRVVQREQPLYLVRELEDRADPVLEVCAGV